MILKCPCGAQLRTRPDQQGKAIGCPKCNRKIRVPVVSAAGASSQSRPANPQQPALGQRPVSTLGRSTATVKKSHRGNPLLIGGLILAGILLVGVLGLAALYIIRTTDNNVAVNRDVTQDRLDSEGEESPSESNSGERDTSLRKSDESGDDQDLTTHESGANDTSSSSESSPKGHAESSGDGAKASEKSDTQKPWVNPFTKNGGDDSNSGDENDDAPTRKEMKLADLIEVVEPCVVRLDTKTRDGDSIGSGVFIDRSGLILTNFHVVQRATSIKVTTSGGKSTKAIGFLVAEPLKDLAIIKISPVVPVKTIDISKGLPRKGVPVAAFGAPLGFSFTASEGVVSSLRTGRELQPILKDLYGFDLYQMLGFSLDTSWVQLTAAISGGNSGGPLVDMTGQLIGINTWHIPEGDDLNFASDINEIRSVISAAEDAKLQPFLKLPKTFIDDVVSGKASPKKGSNGSMSPQEKAYREMVEKRKKQLDDQVKEAKRQAALRESGDEEIVKAEEGEGFEVSKEAYVSRAFDTETSAILRIKLSYDQKYLAALNINGQVFVFDAGAGKLLYRLNSKYRLVREIAFSEKPSRLYTIRDQGKTGQQIAVRQPETGEWKYGGMKNSGRLEARTLAVSRDGKSVFGNWNSTGEALFWRFDAIGDSYRTFSLDAAFGNGIRFGSGGFHATRRIPNVSAFTPDGRYLVTGFSDGWISACSGAGSTMGNTHSKQAHVGSVNDIAMSKAGKKMASVGEGGNIRLTTLTSKSWSGKDIGPGVGEVLGVAITEDEKYVAVTRVGNQLEIYDTNSRKLVNAVELPTLGTDLEFMANDKFLVVGGKDGTIRICSFSRLMGE